MFGKKVLDHNDVVKIVKGLQQMEDPPKTIDVVFFEDGSSVIHEGEFFCDRHKMYTYELKPKGSPERAE